MLVSAYNRARANTHWLVTALVLIVGIALSYGLGSYQYVANKKFAQVRFSAEVRSTADSIEQRLLAYTEVVAGLRDLFLVNPNLSHDQFNFIAEGHNVRASYPEIKNLSFVRKVPAGSLDAFEDYMRTHASYHDGSYANPVHPKVLKDNYYITEFVWPSKGNKGVWGLEISSQPANLDALLWGSETGKPAITKPFSLIQVDHQNTGFLLRFPVFSYSENQNSNKNLEPGISSFIGAIAASVQVSEMLSTVESLGFLKGLSLRLEDIGSIDDNNNTVNQPYILGNTNGFTDSIWSTAELKEVRDIAAHNRVWRLYFVPSVSMLSAAESMAPWLLSAIAVILTFVLTAFAWTLMYKRGQAEHRLHNTNKALAENEQRLGRILDNLPVGVTLIENNQQIVYTNRRFIEISGYSAETTPSVSAWWFQAYPDPNVRQEARTNWEKLCINANHADGFISEGEYKITCQDGSTKTVAISGTILGDDHLVTIEDISRYKTAERQINYLAYYDALTQLPNRRLLLERLEQSLNSSAGHGQHGALLLLDLDHFKSLNETRGHNYGDMLLRKVARRLLEIAKDGQIVARYGDDEFVLVLEGLGTSATEAADEAGRFGRRILDKLCEPYLLSSVQYSGAASIGITIFQGAQDGVNELLKRADLAMYQAKAAGRNNIQFYDPDTQAFVNARVSLEESMRVGIQQGQFYLTYQPQVESGVITGAEALLRWDHPNHGFISPSEFIPIAEDTGLIVPLGEWVLRQVCAQLAQWAIHPVLSGLSLSVNVSPRQFHQSEFVEVVLATLASTGAPTHKLVLELTERLLLQDIEDTIKKMSRLKEYGIGFSLDDFGTGYSSLAYLKRLPLDELKIDQSFVRDVLRDPNDASIARTIVVLGNSLSLRVLAEGVETSEQRDFLEKNNCHAWQGYLLSKPISVPDFEALVEQYRHRII